jgi:glycine dehydrogenase
MVAFSAHGSKCDFHSIRVSPTLKVQMTTGQPSFRPFPPTQHAREGDRHYIHASETDIAAMLETVRAASLDHLFDPLPSPCRFASPPPLPAELSYEEAQERLLALSLQNSPRPSFIGDGLPHYRVMPVVEQVSAIRKLTTAYTPYQPERSQGTLLSHWIYQCLLSQLTGFEAVNSSLYDRSTAIFEAMATAVRLSRHGDTLLLSEGLFPSDREVIETLLPGTGIEVSWVALDPHTGVTDPTRVEAAIQDLGPRLAGFVFHQVNALGLLEDVDALTDLAARNGIRSIAVIDPILLAPGGLKPPAQFGQKGADMLVGEAQHLAIGPNFGGPGLGLFAVRHNATERSTIRQTPGRYIGKARDLSGAECHVMVLSTREQHIRKDKATSNICSNQAFLATLAGASLLERGDAGLREAFVTATTRAREAVAGLTAFTGIELAFPTSAFVNEPVFALDRPVSDLIAHARAAGLHLGVDVSDRIQGDRHLLKLSFSDREVPLTALLECVAAAGFARRAHPPAACPDIPGHHRRPDLPGIPKLETAALVDYYTALGELNLTPDTAIYPLGSCTMKYNPYLNDWAAGLPGFTNLHPQAPLEDCQGALEILFEIQEWFKTITGLAGVTTQPVAGAQGELVGIKLFQAYLRDHGQEHRDVVFIPSSAHGTNFATAVMAGYRPGNKDGLPSGIVLLESGPDGSIDLDDFQRKLDLYRDRLAGVMITNPNTCGIFEHHFREIAAKVREAGGLVYMDGANMNAIAGWCDLGAMGVDAVHNNLHKTWTIPHGGGGPGDAFVAVSERLLPYLPGFQIEKRKEGFVPVKPPASIGRFHRHWGNFAHKVRAYAYLLRLGHAGVRRMPALAVLSSRYCFERLRSHYPSLPVQAGATPRMHEFILTLPEDTFRSLEAIGIPRQLAITRMGKLFLDFGYHAPTVAWPEPLGLMIEPTESYSKAELDRFCDAILAMLDLVREHPAVLHKVPLFAPIQRVDEVEANRSLVLHELIRALPPTPTNRFSAEFLHSLPLNTIVQRILAATTDSPQ